MFRLLENDIGNQIDQLATLKDQALQLHQKVSNDEIQVGFWLRT